MTPRTTFTVSLATQNDLADASTLILRVINDDFGYEGIPAWANDVVQPQSVYLDTPGQCLWIARDHQTGEMLGTTGVWRGGPKSPPHPEWLALRYPPDTAAQLVRVYIARPHRRRGVARALVEAARTWIGEQRDYQVIYFHTHGHIPGAEAFWRSMPTTELYDARIEGDPKGAIHFEMVLPPHVS